jgi:HSP20 family protein
MARNSLVPFGGLGGADPLWSLHREMNRLFDDVLRAPFTGGRTAGQAQAQAAGTPAMINAHMNVSETENEVRVAVELPGVTERDIEVTLNDDLLTIRGEKKIQEERGGEQENFHYVERSYGSFQRSLRLPFDADPEQVRAAFQNGVLTVTVPKSAQQQRSRRIQIQSDAGAQTGERQLAQGAQAKDDMGDGPTQADPSKAEQRAPGAEGSNGAEAGASH